MDDSASVLYNDRISTQEKTMTSKKNNFRKITSIEFAKRFVLFSVSKH